MCDIQNNGKIQREFETRSTDDQPTIQWLPVVGSWTFLGVNMHFNEKLFMCDSCNFLVRAYLVFPCFTLDMELFFRQNSKVSWERELDEIFVLLNLNSRYIER